MTLGQCFGSGSFCPGPDRTIVPESGSGSLKINAMKLKVKKKIATVMPEFARVKSVNMIVQKMRELCA